MLYFTPTDLYNSKHYIAGKQHFFPLLLTGICYCYLADTFPDGLTIINLNFPRMGFTSRITYA